MLPTLRDDQFYYHEIIDYQVEDAVLGTLGTVKEVYSTGAQDVVIMLYKGHEVLCIINCNLGSQVVNELNKFIATPLQRATPLLKGERKSLHGWSCRKLNHDGSL